MAADTIDRLLTSLSVRSHALAACEIKSGYRLAFDPMEAVTIHYVLAGTGAIRIADGFAGAYRPCCVIVVPARTEQSLGEAEATREARASDDNCGLLADGLVRFTAGDGSRDTLVVCANITATYGGALGVFDHLQAPLIEDFTHDHALSAVFATLLREVTDPGVGTQALLEAMMKQILILLLRHHLTRLNSDSPLFAALQDPRLARAVTAVLQRPADAYTVDTLATVAGMSRSTFAERFARVFETTPMEFVQQVRLRLGADLLRTTDLPVKVVAASAGYTSRTYFSRAFRDAHGIDPSAFRARAARGFAALHKAEAPSLAARVLDAVGGAIDGSGA